MTRQLKGRYFREGEALSRPARLIADENGLLLEVEGELDAFRPAIAGISDRLGRLPRKITFADGGVFETGPDPDVTAFDPNGSRLKASIFGLERSGTFVLFAVVASILLLAGMYRYGLPLAAGAAAHVTPEVVVDLIDRGAMQSVDRVFFSESELETARREELGGVFDELAAIAGARGVELHFRDGGRLGANAFALPGGTVIITDQLVELAESDDEIAGVLAHEIGHVTRRHSLERLYRAAGLAFMIGMIGGDASVIVEDIIAQAAALRTLAHSREAELEADGESVRIMIEAGRNPIAFVDLLDRVTDRGGAVAGDTSILSTHPGTGDRRKAVVGLARRLSR